MNLRTKTFLILFLNTTLLLVALYIITSLVLLKGFVAIEDRQLNQNVQRLREIISSEEEFLKVSVNAWSVWDDSYNFMLKNNPEFIKKNFLVNSIFDVRFSQVIFIDLKGKIVFSQDYDYHNRKYFASDPKRLKDIAEHFWKIHLQQDPNKPFTGLYSYQTTFDIYSMNPIVRGNQKGNPSGYMLVFRKFDDEIVGRFEKIIKFKLHTRTIKNPGLSEEHISFKKYEDEVHGFITIPGILKRNALFIEMIMPRTIYLFGKAAITKYLTLLAVAYYFSIFLIFVFFDRYIIKRIDRLKKDLREISNEQSNKSSVEVQGKDEISDLAVNINSTLHTLDQKQTIINRSSKLTALGEMAASVAHEINSPLSVIGGYASKISRLLKNDHIDKEEMESAATKIHNNVFRIDRIIKSLRVVSRDSEQEKKVATTIGAVFDDVHALCQSKLNIRNITLDLTEFNPQLNIYVRPIQMAQVFVNLINNAIDALENHHEAWIKITTKETEDEIIIDVIDSGDIIPDHIAARIMEPFYTTKESGKGTGLGLSISKGMIESHGGKLILKTRPHTCFEIVLPK